MPTAMHVAACFRAMMNVDAGDVVSSLTLHKLLYYAQGFSLAILGKALFKEPIYARSGGPYCPDAMEEPIDSPFWSAPSQYSGSETYVAKYWTGDRDEVLSAFTKEQRDLLRDVWRAYGQFSGWKLREIMMEDALWGRCWDLAMELSGDDVEIPRKDMKRHFKMLVAGMEEDDDGEE